MSKKNKKYNPRHVKSEEILNENVEIRPLTADRYPEEEQFRANGVSSVGSASDQAPAVQQKRTPYPSFVRVPDEEQPAASDKTEDTGHAEPDEDAGTVAQNAPEDNRKPAIDPAEVDAVVISVAPAEEASPEELRELYGETEAISEETEHKTRHKKRWKRVLIIVISIPLALIIALVGTFFVMREIGRRNIQDNDQKIELSLPTEDGFDKQVSLGDRYGRIITYKGNSYVYNNDIITLTFIGADDGHGAEKDLHMADAIYVIAIDTKTGKIKMLNVSRDIMTDVDVYSLEGAFIDTEEIQIAYSNAYSGEGITGAENTNKSLSRLMFGLPLENYFEFDLGAVSTLNDAIGGVTVTSALTFTSPEDGRVINEGDVVTLHGEEAEYYIRRRDITKLTSNNDRMKRQQDYIMSFLSSIVPVAKEDVSVISDLYNAISENSQTSLNAADLVYIASTAVTNLDSLSDIEFVKFNGEITAGINAEMRVTNDEVLSKMLDVFYKPLSVASTDATAFNSVSESTAAGASEAAAAETKKDEEQAAAN